CLDFLGNSSCKVKRYRLGAMYLASITYKESFINAASYTSYIYFSCLVSLNTGNPSSLIPI
ncbi:MAG: hypothetical protein LBG28_07910, partial [Tannerella sp.]|nr:hypothetical protein [Tannerella sp.]